jgi:hypothetical protein
MRRRAKPSQGRLIFAERLVAAGSRSPDRRARDQNAGAVSARTVRASVPLPDGRRSGREQPHRDHRAQCPDGRPNRVLIVVDSQAGTTHCRARAGRIGKACQQSSVAQNRPPLRRAGKTPHVRDPRGRSTRSAGEPRQRLQGDRPGERVGRVCLSPTLAAGSIVVGRARCRGGADPARPRPRPRPRCPGQFTGASTAMPGARRRDLRCPRPAPPSRRHGVLLRCGPFANAPGDCRPMPVAASQLEPPSWRSRRGEIAEICPSRRRRARSTIGMLTAAPAPAAQAPIESVPAARGRSGRRRARVEGGAHGTDCATCRLIGRPQVGGENLSLAAALRVRWRTAPVRCAPTLFVRSSMPRPHPSRPSFCPVAPAFADGVADVEIWPDGPRGDELPAASPPT